MEWMDALHDSDRAYEILYAAAPYGQRTTGTQAIRREARYGPYGWKAILRTDRRWIHRRWGNNPLLSVWCMGLQINRRRTKVSVSMDFCCRIHGEQSPKYALELRSAWAERALLHLHEDLHVPLLLGPKIDTVIFLFLFPFYFLFSVVSFFYPTNFYIRTIFKIEWFKN
jgi:hypothetical protein